MANHDDAPWCYKCTVPMVTEDWLPLFRIFTFRCRKCLRRKFRSNGNTASTVKVSTR